jgi:hypothetical protein
MLNGLGGGNNGSLLYVSVIIRHQVTLVSAVYANGRQLLDKNITVGSMVFLVKPLAPQISRAM